MTPDEDAGPIRARDERWPAVGEDARGRTFAAAVARGDEDAVATAVRHHLPRLIRYVARLGADPGLAEDIAQEALVRAVLSVRRGRAPQDLGSWLYAVCTNLWRDAARSAERRHTVIGLPVDALPPTREVAATLEDAVELQQAVRQLPLALRAVVVLRFHEGLSIKEIALVTGAPVGTVKWRMFTALRRLRSQLGPSIEGDGEK